MRRWPTPLPPMRVANVVVLTVLGGLGAGLTGAAMVWMLLHVQTLTYGTASESLLEEVRAASGVRRALGPLAGGLLAGMGWWLLRRRGPVLTVEEAIKGEGRPLPARRTLADAVLQVVVVGSGASIGREGAPRQASAAITDTLARRLRVAPETGRVAVAAAAGAGLAAVYNVPLAGAVFTLEVLDVPCRWTTVLLTAGISGIATVTAWPVVTHSPTYDVPDVPATLPALEPFPTSAGVVCRWG